MSKSPAQFRRCCFFVWVAVVACGPPGIIGAQEDSQESSQAEDAQEAGEASAEPIASMLAELGLTRADLAPDATNLLLQRSTGGFTPLATRLMLRPLDAPYVVGHMTAGYRNWSHSIVMTLLRAAGQTPAGVMRGYTGNPLGAVDKLLTDSEEPLITAIDAIFRVRGKAPPAGDELDKLRAGVAGIPAPWRLEIARLLAASAAAAEWQERALEPVRFRGRMDILERPVREILRSAMGIGNSTLDLRPLIRGIDFDYLLAGAQDLAVALEDFEHFIETGAGGEAAIAAMSALPGPLRIETPLGWVVISGGDRDDDHGANQDGNLGGHHLLIVDLAGDDTYRASVTEGGPDWPVQIIIDLAGADRYLAGEDPNAAQRPLWGGALAGYSFLLDRAGDDHYQAISCAMGGAVLGVGVLIDRAGDDKYEAIAHAQGASWAGLGVLWDGGGNDQYDSVTRSQGAGENLGVGVLLDDGGDDVYRLNDEKLFFPSAQTREHNASLGQGMGDGFRADSADGKPVPGGVGLLYDRAGNDRYSAGVFAQGSGFLGGVGLLVDDAGDDVYDAVYYAQGASAHRAVGMLIDRAGDDRYTALMQAAQGLGHDFGLGWLLDMGGDDQYRAERLALGAGNENGWGFFIDLAGDDTYEITSGERSATALGAAKLTGWGTMREDAPALGFFLDAGGRDSYKGLARAGDNRSWQYTRSHDDFDYRSERGVGRDGEYGSDGESARDGESGTDGESGSDAEYGSDGKSSSVDLRTGPMTEFPQRALDDYARTQDGRRKYREWLDGRE